jgi:hypothetical protein
MHRKTTMPFMRVFLCVLFLVLLLLLDDCWVAVVGGMKQQSEIAPETTSESEHEPAGGGSPRPSSPSLSSSLKLKEKEQKKKAVQFADPPRQLRDERPNILMMADSMAHSHYTLMVFFFFDIFQT